MNAQKLALALLEWHGGGGSPLYAVGSTMFAGHLDKITYDMVRRACLELYSNGADCDLLRKQLLHWYETKDGTELTIEHASVRQNVKHGYILVYMKYSANSPNDRGTCYEHVDSWHIYRTKKLAQEEINRRSVI